MKPLTPIKQSPQKSELFESKALSFLEFKESLGPNASKYTEEQIEQMRVICDTIADVFFDDWLLKKNRA